MFIAITASLQEEEAARRINAADNQSLLVVSYLNEGDTK